MKELVETIFKIEKYGNNSHIVKTSTENGLFADVNAAAIVLSEYIIVIDTTLFPYHARKFRDTLQLEYNKPVKFVLLTHYHGDHVLGLKSFDDCQIIASKPMIKRMTDRLSTTWSKEALAKWSLEDENETHLRQAIEVRLPTISFDNNLIMYDGDYTIEMRHTGGHTVCSSYIYLEKDKTVIAGDLLFNDSFPYGGDDSCNPDQWIETLKEILNLKPEIVIPGHGGMMSVKEIEAQLRIMEEIRTLIIESVSINIPLDKIDTSKYDEPENFAVPRTFEQWYNHYKKQQSG